MFRVVSKRAARVAKGGHNIPLDVIERRYKRSVENLFEVYLPICDRTTIVNNSGAEPELIADCWADGRTDIINADTWQAINQYER
jgi:predicted ABC-type ATPase